MCSLALLAEKDKFENIYEWMNDFILNAIDADKIKEEGAYVICNYERMYRGFSWRTKEMLKRLEFRKILKSHYKFSYHLTDNGSDGSVLKLRNTDYLLLINLLNKD